MTRLRYIRNTQPSPDLGPQYGQDIEPAGMYVLERPSSFRAMLGWETGVIKLENPLVIDWGSGLYSDEDNWKRVLHRKYKKKGKALSKALLKDGYDAIITMRDGETSEIVILSVAR